MSDPRLPAIGRSPHVRWLALLAAFALACSPETERAAAIGATPSADYARNEALHVTLMREGHRIRIAVAGADSDSFLRYPRDGGIPTIRIHRGGDRGSHVILPMRDR